MEPIRAAALMGSTAAAPVCTPCRRKGRHTLCRTKEAFDAEQPGMLLQRPVKSVVIRTQWSEASKSVLLSVLTAHRFPEQRLKRHSTLSTPGPRTVLDSQWSRDRRRTRLAYRHHDPQRTAGTGAKCRFFASGNHPRSCCRRCVAQTLDGWITTRGNIRNQSIMATYWWSTMNSESAICCRKSTTKATVEVAETSEHAPPRLRDSPTLLLDI